MRVESRRFPRYRTTLGSIILASLGWVAPLSPLEAQSPQPIASATTISSPGKYIVVRDIVAEPPIVAIYADDVELDLGGYTLSSNSGGQSPIIYIADASGVTVKNGRIAHVNLGVAVAAESCREVRLEELHTSRAMVRSVDTTLSIVKSVIERVGADALRVLGGSCSVESSSIRGGPATVHVTADDFSMVRSRVFASIDGVIVRGDRARIVKSTVTAGDNGLWIAGDSAHVSDSTISGIVYGLVLVGSHGILEDNSLTGLRAIDIDGDLNRIVDNRFRAGRLRFLPSSSGNAYGRNTGDWGTQSLPPPHLMACAGPSTKTFCDEGVGNRSLGGNYMPDLM